MAEEEKPSITLSLTTLSQTEVHQQLRQWESQDVTAKITDAKQPHNFGVALGQSISVEVTGDLGDYAFMMASEMAVEILGNVGRFCGHSLESGSVLVHGNVGNGFGSFATGGIVACTGTAADRCGSFIDGADVIVRSDAGDEAGIGMRNGSLVLGKNVGHRMGIGMTGGVLYVRGTVESASPHLRETRMKDSDSMRLGLLLARAGIRAATKEFRCYRPRSASPTT